MAYTTEKNIQENGDNFSPTPARRKTGIFFEEFTAEELKQALLSSYEKSKPLEELIATAEAAFEFIRLSDMDVATKNAFGRLEIQFQFYKKLVES